MLKIHKTPTAYTRALDVGFTEITWVMLTWETWETDYYINENKQRAIILSKKLEPQNPDDVRQGTW